jgi:ubiquinone/menaquinone biosynthesis C-methylase UbiE
VITRKSEKELAFIHDLFIAPDWGERFAELMDEHVMVPREGNALYLGVGTGGHAMALQERAGDDLSLLCIDENEDFLVLAQAKGTALSAQTRFRQSQLDQLSLPDNHFDLVIGNASLVARQRLAKMLAEMVRVAAPGSFVALALPTSSSFGEFFSIYWEALHNSGLLTLESDVEHLITELPTVSDIEQMAEGQGLENISSWTRIEEFDFESGEQFLESPLVAEFLMQAWLTSVPETFGAKVAKEISRLINEERHEAEFALTLKATLVAGRKDQSH